MHRWNVALKFWVNFTKFCLYMITSDWLSGKQSLQRSCILIVWPLKWLIFMVWHIDLHSAIVETKHLYGYSHPYPLLYWCMTSSLFCGSAEGVLAAMGTLIYGGRGKRVSLWLLWKRGPGLHSIWVRLPAYGPAFVRVCFICLLRSWVMQDGVKSHQLGRGVVGFSWNPSFSLAPPTCRRNTISQDLAVKTRMKTLV